MKQGQTNSDDVYLFKINQELQERRSAARELDIKEFGSIYNEVLLCLSAGEFNKARDIAQKLRDTMLYRDIIELFLQYKETFSCNNCGETIGGIAFNKDTLTWIRPHLCISCEEKEQKREENLLTRGHQNFVDQNMNSILQAIGVEELLLKASFDDFPATVIEQCKRSLLGRHGIYIYGDVGVGKSWLASAYLKTLIRDVNPIKQSGTRRRNGLQDFRQLFRFIYVPSLLAEIKNSYDKQNDETEKQIISEYTRIPVLVLDDLATENPNGWVRQRLNMIIYYRDARMLKTVYTSNKGLDELSEWLDVRISSRIRRHCEIIHLIGPDRRRI